MLLFPSSRSSKKVFAGSRSQVTLVMTCAYPGDLFENLKRLIATKHNGRRDDDSRETVSFFDD